MDQPLDTSSVWQIDGEWSSRTFLSAAESLLSEGDVALFGAYEPTRELSEALLELGCKAHNHLEGFYTCFDINRSEHPDGCVFAMPIGSIGFSQILSLEPAILRQNDNPEFYDHFVAYRLDDQRIPLMSHHDAFSGGSLFLSTVYAQEDVETLSASLGGEAKMIENPVLTIHSRSRSR
ncbi:MAG: hypothetical protein AAGA58_00165 [Verrucomicrobiota bacterium]